MYPSTNLLISLTLFTAVTVAKLVNATASTDKNPDHVQLNPPNAWSPPRDPLLGITPACGWRTNSKNANAIFTFRGSSLSVYGGVVLIDSNPIVTVSSANTTVTLSKPFNATVDGTTLQYAQGPIPDCGLLFENTTLNPEIEHTFLFHYIAGVPEVDGVSLQYVTYEGIDPVSGSTTTPSSTEAATSTAPSNQTSPNSSTYMPSAEPSTPPSPSAPSSSPSDGSISNPVYPSSTSNPGISSPGGSNPSGSANTSPSSSRSTTSHPSIIGISLPLPTSQNSVNSPGSSAIVSTPILTGSPNHVLSGLVADSTVSTYRTGISVNSLASISGTGSTNLVESASDSLEPTASLPTTTPTSVDTISASTTNGALPSDGVSRGEASHVTNNGHRTGVIAGSTVGAVLGAVLIAGAAASHREWLKYVWSSLAFALGFGFYYSARRFIFVGDKDLPETRIALFISPAQPADEKEDEILVWNACTVGTAQNKNEVFFDLPCGSNGHPRLFFGRYQRRNDYISCTEYAEAPAVLEQSQGSTEPHLIRQTHEDTRNQLISAVNRSTAPMTLALGTGRKISTQGDMGILPFMTIPESHFGAGTTYQLEGDLYLHAFKVKNECQGGRFYPQAVGAESMPQDRITEPHGIKLDELKGLTTILVKQGKDGRLALKIVKNKKKDLKKYQHECKIDQSALRQEYREIEPSVNSSV